MKTVMRYPGNVVTEDDTRAKGAGSPDKCFYCKGVPGGPHDEDCVCIHRPVKIRMSLDLVVEKPRSWSKEDIEFFYNESSSCKNNLITEIERHTEDGGCLCSRSEVEYMGEATLEEAAEANLMPDRSGQ